MFKCNSCGAKIKDDNAEICPECGGQAQTKKQWEQRMFASKKRTSRLSGLNVANARSPLTMFAIKWILAGIAIVVMLVILAVKLIFA